MCVFVLLKYTYIHIRKLGEKMEVVYTIKKPGNTSQKGIAHKYEYTYVFVCTRTSYTAAFILHILIPKPLMLYSIR